MTYMFNTCMHLITEELETRAADPTVTTLESLHSGTAVPYILNDDVIIPAVGMKHMMTSVLTTLQDKGTTDTSICTIGNPKLVMLFIMRPQLTASEEDKRFCNGAVDTLKTAVRMSGESMDQDASGCLASDKSCYSIESYTQTPGESHKTQADIVESMITTKFQEANSKEETRKKELSDNWERVKDLTKMFANPKVRRLAPRLTKSRDAHTLLSLQQIPTNTKFNMNQVYEYIKSTKYLLTTKSNPTIDELMKIVGPLGKIIGLHVQQLQDELQKIRTIYYREGTWPPPPKTKSKS